MLISCKDTTTTMMRATEIVCSVSLGLYILALGLFLAGLGSQYWVVIDPNEDVIFRFGLWVYCSDMSTVENEVNCYSVDIHNSEGETRMILKDVSFPS